MPPNWKPEKRIKATPKEWEAIRAEKLGPCRVCGKPNAVGLTVYPAKHWNASGLESTLHHIIPKSLGGDDVADGVAPACGSGTTGCHGLIENRDPWACTLFGANLTVSERAYVIRKKGTDFAVRYYGMRDAA